jgi:hypothetical protein
LHRPFVAARLIGPNAQAIHMPQPGDAAGQAQPAEIDHRHAAADRGEIAEIAIAELSRQRFSSQPRVTFSRCQLANWKKYTHGEFFAF